MKRQPAFAFFLLFIVFTLAFFMVGSVAEGEAPDVSTIQATEFGMTFVNSAEWPSNSTRIQRGISTGAKLDRLPLYWDRIEASAGELDWSGQDAALRGNEQHGLGTLAILLNTSPVYWPTGRRMPAEMPRVGDGIRKLLEQGQERAAECPVQGPPAPNGLYEPIFTDGTDHPAPNKTINLNNSWARFVSLTVNRYRPGGTAGLNVRYWEIWNEPDLCHFWGGTSQEYARLLKVAYLIIKHFDPEATVVWGGLALYGPKYESGANFLYEMLSTIQNDPLAASHNGFFDAAAIHQYSNVYNGYYFTLYVQNALAGTPWQNKPIWVTESGLPVCDSFPGPDCPTPYRGNLEEQASYIWQNVAYTRIANNDAPIFHFQLHDDGGNECRPKPPADAFGLLTNKSDAHCVPHHAIARPAYTTFQLATQYFAHTELVSDHFQDEHIRQVTFYHPETNESRVLVWSIDGRDGVANVPATGNSAVRISPDGRQETITPVDGTYDIPVTGAIARNNPLEATYPVGGKPYLLIERDIQAPTVTMNELPPVSLPTFNVTWDASDIGSGVESVTVLLQTGDESRQLPSPNPSGGPSPRSGGLVVARGAGDESRQLPSPNIGREAADESRQLPSPTVARGAGDESRQLPSPNPSGAPSPRSGGQVVARGAGDESRQLPSPNIGREAADESRQFPSSNPSGGSGPVVAREARYESHQLTSPNVGREAAGEGRRAGGEGRNFKWQTWLTNQPASGSAIFRGQIGSQYRFTVQATDHAGNRNEDLIVLASTFVNDGARIAQVSGQVRDMKGQPASWALVSIGQAGLFANETGHFSVTVPVGEWDVKVQNQIQRHGLLFYQDSTYPLLLPPNHNPVINGDFEQESLIGVSGWDVSGSSLYQIESVRLSQEHILRLARRFVANPNLPGDDGPGTGGNSTISQRLTVPAGKPTLALIYKVESAETVIGGSCEDSTIHHDKFEIIIEKNDELKQIHCQEVGSEWQYGFFDLSAYAGEEITLTFNVYESSPNRRTSVLIDLITIGESPHLTEPKSTYLPLIPHKATSLQPWSIYLPLMGR